LQRFGGLVLSLKSLTAFAMDCERENLFKEGARVEVAFTRLVNNAPRAMLSGFIIADKLVVLPP
jgi:hypothetical protein